MPFLPVTITEKNTWHVGPGDVLISVDQIRGMTAEQIGENVMAIARQLNIRGVRETFFTAPLYYVETFEMLLQWHEHFTPKKPNKNVIKLRGVIKNSYDAVFLQLGRRDGFHCKACNKTEDLEIDHYMPIAKGGSNTLENLQLLCYGCNRGKRARSPEPNEQED